MESRFHAGARSALKITAILCCITIIGLPFGLWLWYRVTSSRLVVDATGVTARALGTVRVEFADVARLGVLSVPIVAGGIAGVLARRKVGGDAALHLCFQTRAGKTRRFMVSMFDRHEEVAAAIAQRLQLPLETLSMGLMGPKWPDTGARAA
jgi:hypothetical protein